VNHKSSPLLRHILAEPWTDDDQQTLATFLEERLAQLDDACQREGPDSDAAHTAVSNGATLKERDQLEAQRLASGARYNTDGYLLDKP
jgi:hypothetical protein